MDQIKLDVSKPFWLKDYYIEPEKGLISRFSTPETTNIESTSSAPVLVEPKVMQVLLLLVKQRGELVSQESIFATVWPQSIFNPSSIQRCIAILRKTLGDDAKTQQVIKTHPKRGYSLVADVRQSHHVDDESKLPSNSDEISAVSPSSKEVDNMPRFVGFKYWKSTIILLVSLCILLLLNERIWQSSEQPAFQQIELQVLSSSEDDEYFPRFSYDLRYTAYVKETTQANELWLREGDSERHRFLYAAKNPVLSLAWLKSIHALIFAELEYVDDNAHFLIKRLTLTGDSVDVKLLQRIEGYIFLGDLFIADDHVMYALVQSADSYSMNILRLDLVSGQHNLLPPFLDELSLNDMALSHDGRRLALVAEDKYLNEQVFEYELMEQRLTPRIKLQSAHNQVSWHPNDKTLLINDGQKLRLLDANNQLSPINYVSLSELQDVSFAGPDRIVFSLVKRDSDIVSYTIGGEEHRQDATELINSTQIDHSARLSPQADKLAFVSKRGSVHQLYVRAEGSEKLLVSTENDGTRISAPLWQSESSLFVAINGELKRIATGSGLTEDFAIDIYVLHLLSWHPDTQTLLLAYRQAGEMWMGRYDPKAQTLTPVYLIKPEWAAHAIANNNIVVIQNNRLFLVDKDGQLVQLWDSQKDNIEMSVNSASGMYFQVRQAAEYQLWHFDLETRQASKVMDVPDNQILIDISQDESTALFRRLEKEMDIALIKQADVD
ncbi:winged helix-turn-helix domain-containing protein [Alteromonas facilis]|uniref:winged helix-turn-helix domain-containing protein n=1 Tax=Alteromonas facilis TaxID=2048004 RepID=UPI000C284E78|nr:winged helix-turn-helix domain-containing protein [Alteromonas facilis]